MTDHTVAGPLAHCDLHVHSIHSTDSGNYALRRARLGESFTPPERVARVCAARGMRFITLSDHNTLEGAKRIAHLPGSFMSVEVTTRFPEDDLPLHVLVWDLTAEDHADLQPLRPSVYELVAFLRERRLHHALAHPLYRMGPPIDVSHVERMMLLFGVWEGRNGARAQEQNDLACRLAGAVTPAYLAKLSQRHGIEPSHGRVALCAGSDDHGAFDIATTFTAATAASVREFLDAVRDGTATMHGGHGSTEKLAHAVSALVVNAFRAGGGRLTEPWCDLVEALFDDDADDADERHREISEVAALAVRQLGARAREGGYGVDALPSLGARLGTLVAAGAVHLPYLATASHHADSRSGLRQVEEAFFGVPAHAPEPRALVFTDTYDETNGVANAMRRLAVHASTSGSPTAVLTARDVPADEPGLIAVAAEWTLPLPTYEAIGLRFPNLLELLARVERERPDLIHVATPGPVGLCGLIAARALGVPVVGSYHTELGPYALHLTRDLLVSQATGAYVDWFYRQCGVVLAPTQVVAEALTERGYRNVMLWGRSVDAARFAPQRRSEEMRRELLGPDGDLLLLSVGRVSTEKRLDVLLEAFACLRRRRPRARLAVVGDGPAREPLAASAPDGVRFMGEVRGDELARLYASADIFCFPSTTDTFGQVLLEAGASGLPVVAAEAGGAAELVIGGQTGLLVKPDDADGFAVALHRLAGDARMRRRFGARGRALAAERTDERFISELTHAYRIATRARLPFPDGEQGVAPVPPGLGGAG